MAKPSIFKRIVLTAILAFCFLGAGIVFSACGDEHTHACTNYTVVTAATCTSEGLEKGNCDVCGQEIRRVIPKTEHTLYESKAKVEPTCTTVGYTHEMSCSVCNAVIESSVEIPVLPHNFGDWTISVGATCQMPGKQEHTCQTCQYVESQVIPTTEHSHFVTIERQEPTCTNAGHTQRVICSMCGTVLEESQLIQPTGHSYGSWIEVDTASCTQDGLRKRECSVCFNIETEQVKKLDHTWGQFTPIENPDGMPKHQKECSVCHTTEEYECNFANRQVFYPSCLEEGKMVEYCTACNREAVISTERALGHDYKFHEIKLDEHSGEDHTHQHYQQCERCGDRLENQNCQLQPKDTVQATCTTDGYTIFACDDCGAVHEVINSANLATGHTWEYENVVMNPIQQRHKRICSVCNAEEEERCSLNIQTIKADCENDGHMIYSCNKCNKSTKVGTGQNKLGHILQYQFTGSDKDHATHTITCARPDCNYRVENVQCDLVSSSLEPTCDEAGENSYSCSLCHEEFTEQGELASGHDWQLTRYDANKHYYTCNKCNQTKEEEHEFTIVEITAAECEQNQVTKQVCQHCEYQTDPAEQAGTALKHKWKISDIKADKHTGECELCHEHITREHDFADSNVCSVCEFDGLTYRIEGTHVVVSKSPATMNSKNIVISTYRELLSSPVDGEFYNKTEHAVTAIEKNAFYRCFNVETVTIPETVTEIREGAFTGLNRLREVTILGENPQLKRVEDMAFLSCAALSKFVGAKDLEFIGEYAFSNCTALNEITVSDELKDIEQHAFLNTGFANDSAHWVNDALYLGKHLIKVRQTLQADGKYSNSEFSIKAGTISIAANAFEGCTHLTTLTINPELERIDRDAFKDCTALAQVNYSGNVYGWLAITFANDYASPLFHGNTGLHIDEAEGVVDLTDASKVTRTITSIPAGTFRGTGITEIILPNTITHIGSEAFENCTNLAKISFKDGCNVIYIGEDVLNNTAYYKNTANWDQEKVLYIDGKILVEAKTDLAGTYTVKSGTTAVAARAFEGCEGLTMVTFNSELQYIGENVFAGCTSMEKVAFAGDNINWYSNRLDYGVTHMYTFKSTTEADQKYNYQIISQNKGACTKKLSQY